MNTRMGSVVETVIRQGYHVVPTATGAYHIIGTLFTLTIARTPRTDREWAALAVALRGIGVNAQFGWEFTLDV